MIFAKICIMQWPAGDSPRSASNLPTGRIVKCTPNNAGQIPGSNYPLLVPYGPAESKSGESSRK
jgi:hypothetical protein